MPTPTYIPLATITLASTDSEIVFSSIPATYRDLILVMNFTTTVSEASIVRFNGDTGSNYPYVVMGGRPTTTTTSVSGTETGIITALSAELAGQLGAYVMQIMDYSATDKHKTALVRSNYRNSTFVEAIAARWANTAAITSLSILPFTGAFDVGSTFSLYGVN